MIKTKRNISLGILGGFFILLVIFMGCSNPPQSPESQIDQKVNELKSELLKIRRQKLELILDRLHEKNLFNGVILIVSQGQELLSKSYGYADFRSKRPLQAQSGFRIGALTKSFTAVALMQLVEQGALSLEDSIQQFVPELSYPPITLYQLLNHTSGLPDYLDTFYLNESEMLDYTRNQDVISWLQQDDPPLTFLPGLKWGYSHTNYVLLAEVIEEVSQMSLGAYFEKNIFQPLAMKNTTLPAYREDPKIAERVYGFRTDNEQLYDDSFLNTIYGDRGLYATLEDLYIWDQAFNSDKIISPASVEKIFEPALLADGQTYPYGFGWHIKADGNTVYHYGGWLGFRAALLRNPRQKNTIIALSNNLNPAFQEIVEMIDDIINNRPYKMPR